MNADHAMHHDGLGADVLDFEARYRVEGYEGVAFYLTGYDVGAVDEDGFVDTDTSRVRAVMVGDDRVHVLDVSELHRLADEDYCSQCGQIGCSHDGREA